MCESNPVRLSRLKCHSYPTMIHHDSNIHTTKKIKYRQIPLDRKYFIPKGLQHTDYVHQRSSLRYVNYSVRCSPMFIPIIYNFCSTLAPITQWPRKHTMVVNVRTTSSKKQHVAFCKQQAQLTNKNKRQSMCFIYKRACFIWMVLSVYINIGRELWHRYWYVLAHSDLEQM